ncbi:hypothetical protein DERF_011957 [Dermatophagoides farinae]|uniref:Uncharacterized protein n=1 Tax=Dermatophagoides farinae TaxID=6954 RepID=A0A922HQY5_DERFA|nr:hypothetical protein HUG17_9163 [Dermatophagoides farinae]KAH9501088.1 hypothetical protein DERF_011957 [Dermatophagoides farinae]
MEIIPGIINPLLKNIIFTHGFILPLRPFEWRNIHWTLINIIVNLWSFIHVYRLATNEVNNLSRKNNEQPLFVYYIKVHHFVVIPMIFLGFIWHYFHNGHSIMKLLDHSLFTRTMYRCWPQSFYYTISIELFMNGIYMMSRHYYIRSFLFHGDWQAFQEFFIFYIFYCYLLITWLLIFYQQIAINLALKNYRQEFLQVQHEHHHHDHRHYDWQQYPDQIERKKRLFNRIKNLAQLNGQIQTLMSPIMFIAFTSESLHVVDTMNQILIRGFRNYWHKCLERIIRTLFYIGICWLNNENLQQFKWIQNILVCRKQDLIQRQTYTYYTMNRVKRKININNDRSTVAIYSKFNWLKIYHEKLKLPVNYLFTINATLCLNWFFFLISYVSLIYQTRND